jgi:hypothetical protein
MWFFEAKSNNTSNDSIDFFQNMGALLCGPPVLCCPDGAAWESMVINLGSFGICSASFVAFVEYTKFFLLFLKILWHFILFCFFCRWARKRPTLWLLRDEATLGGSADTSIVGGGSTAGSGRVGGGSLPSDGSPTQVEEVSIDVKEETKSLLQAIVFGIPDSILKKFEAKLAAGDDTFSGKEKKAVFTALHTIVKGDSQVWQLHVGEGRKSYFLASC